MAYRNGTYIAFHAEGTSDPTASDMKYYQLMKAWTGRGDDDFALVNSHEKASSVRDSSKKATLRASLQERLRNSKNMLLIIGESTRLDTDWVPFEIEQAVDVYEIPIIAAYTFMESRILAPQHLAPFWPSALATRIANQAARVMHIPIKKPPIADSIAQFSHNSLPPHGLWYYSAATYDAWQIS